MSTSELWFALDARPLLPSNWQADLAALAAGADLVAVIREPQWRFDVVSGNALSCQLDWLWRLYHGPFRRFASASFARPLFPSNRRDATVTLNVLSGRGATNAWHRDANPVTGVLFGSSLAPADGGALEFNRGAYPSASLQPQAGTFVCFAGQCEHRVAPLTGNLSRLAIAMTYYNSAADQPFASDADRYDPPV